jgi:hypothetical protein
VPAAQKPTYTRRHGRPRKAAANGEFEVFDLADLETPKSRRPSDSPRARAQRERQERVRKALFAAAALPSSKALKLRPIEGEKMATLRLAVIAVQKLEGLPNVNRAIKTDATGPHFVLSTGAIKGARKRKV